MVLNKRLAGIFNKEVEYGSHFCLPGVYILDVPSYLIVKRNLQSRFCCQITFVKVVFLHFNWPDIFVLAKCTYSMNFRIDRVLNFFRKIVVPCTSQHISRKTGHARIHKTRNYCQIGQAQQTGPVLHHFLNATRLFSSPPSFWEGVIRLKN